MGRLNPATLICLFFLPAGTSYSASFTWNQDAALGNDWVSAAPTHWTPNTGYPNAVGDEAKFGGIITTNRDINMNGPITIGALQFDSIHNYTLLLGNDLTFQMTSGSATITVTNQTGSPSINTKVVLASPLTISQNSTGLLTLGAEISGAQPITISGSQKTLFSGVNTFSEGITISSGTLQVGADTALGNTSGAITMSGGTFQTTAMFLTDPARSFSMTASSNIDTTGGQLTIQGSISGGGALTKTGSNTLILTGTNSYSGGTVINAGTLMIASDAKLGASATSLAIANNATLDVSSSFTSSRPMTLTGTANINTNANTLTLSGVISGSGTLTKLGAGGLILTGTSNTYGGTNIGGGYVQGNSLTFSGNIVSNGTLANSLIFDQTLTGTYSGIISGGSLMKIQGGGSLTLTADSSGFLGATDLTASTQLIMNGNLGGSALTIGSGSVLRGTGTVGPTTNNGRIYPGNSIGTITVNGNLTFNPGSSLFLEIEPLDSSKVTVTGSANLTNGDLIISPLAGFYGLNRTYTILTAAGGLGGTTFNTVTSNNSNFLPTASYLPTSVVLSVQVLRPFSDFPYENENERAVGNNLDELIASGTASSGLIDVVNSFAGGTFHQISEALDQMHPAAMSALAELQGELGAQMLSLFHHKPTLLCGCSTPNRIWAQPFGNWLDEKQQGEEIGFDVTTRGFAVGYDREVLDVWTLGGGIAWSASDLRWSLNRGHAYIETFYGSFYADLAVGDWYFGTSVYGGVDWNTTARGIHFFTTDSQADAHYKSIDLGWQVTSSYFFGTPSFLFYPYLTFDCLYLHNGGYSETGAGALNLEVKDYTSGTLRSEAGFAFQLIDRNYEETICVSPLVGMGWVMEWPFYRDHYHSTFTGESIPFTTVGWHQIWQLLNLQFGLAITYKCFTLDSQFILDISPDGNSPLLNQRANFNLRYNF